MRNKYISSENVHTTVLALFFLSGVSALIYQIVWVRFFTVVFGVTVFAVSTVVASFMAGLALGSFFIGKRADKYESPLRMFAYLEAGIAIYALLIPSLIFVVSNIYTFLYQSFTPNFYLFSIIRFVFSFLILIIPTTLMGGTLPVLSKFLVRKLGNLGWNVGSLYSINTWGAVIGCCAAGFFLIQILGAQMTNYVAVSINLFITVMVLVSEKRLAIKVREGQTAKDSKPLLESEGDGYTYSKHILCLVLFVFTLEGFTSLAYEIVWTRILASTVLMNSVYSFSIVVIGFLCGLALGSFICARFIDGKKRLLSLFGSIVIAIGLSSLLLLFIFGKLEFIVSTIYSLVGKPHSWWGIIGVEFMLCLLVMLVPTTLMGTTFPLVSKIYARSLKRVGQDIGGIFCLDTVGSIFGSFVAGFVFIPLIGLQKSIVVLSIFNMIMGVTILLCASSMHHIKKWTVGFVLLISMVMVGIAMPTTIYCRIKGVPGERLLYYKEDVAGTVTVREYRDVSFPSQYVKVLEVNGTNVAGTEFNLISTQKMQGHLPLLLHGNPEQVLIVGFGSGGTSWSVAQHEVREIDAVELVPSVVDAARKHFRECNHNIFKDVRFKLIIGDGKNYVLMTNKKYDVILTESVHPLYEGNASLYNRDYFQSCRDQLNEDGLMSVWLPLYRLSDDDFRMIVRSFVSVFPHASMWYTTNCRNRQVLLIGSVRKLRIDFKKFVERVEAWKVRGDLKEVHMDNPLALLDSFMMSEHKVAVYCKDARINTDDHPYLEFSAPKAINLDLETTYQNLSTIYQLRESVFDYLSSIGNSDRINEVRRNMASYFDASQHTIAGILFYIKGEHEKGLYELRHAMEINPQAAHIERFVESEKSRIKNMYFSMGTRYQEEGMYDEAALSYKDALRIDRNFLPALINLCLVYNSLGRYEEAINELKRALEIAPQSVEVHHNLAIVYINKGMYDEALRELKKTLELSPHLVNAYDGLAHIYKSNGRYDDAIIEFKRAITRVPHFVKAHYYLAMFYNLQGRHKEAKAELEEVLKLDPQAEDVRVVLKRLEALGY